MTIPKYYIYILCIYMIYIVTDASPLIQEPHAAPTVTPGGGTTGGLVIVIDEDGEPDLQHTPSITKQQQQQQPRGKGRVGGGGKGRGGARGKYYGRGRGRGRANEVTVVAAPPILETETTLHSFFPRRVSLKTHSGATSSGLTSCFKRVGKIASK
jgi:hypothetical protein